ncbi:craniofacial development protein 2-like [Bombyx mandarina]|uniref:Craniofacial development protein 2-like n=1 Tax=Bombyx mandarina TaxID=7092 RepID=A0A6J2J989_BOMMA|nr:craniofacial development protein 2-like [Bombyx mandarina]
MGDFNAKIGKPRHEEFLVTEPFGLGTRNEIGQKLIDFALETKTAIMNTYYYKKPNRRWTWRSPSDKYKNEIDYILSNIPQKFHNVEVLNINYPSDHRPVRATISLEKIKISRTRYKTKQCANLKYESEILRFR